MNLTRILLILLALGLPDCTKKENKLFERLSASDTGINFRNDLHETAVFNIIEYLYFYNGGGVAIGDINNDGLSDIYFTSNQNPNRLYLNKGNFKFEDVTERAGVGGKGNWKTGVTMADVNGDGWLDIFVCGVGRYKEFSGFNQLFINNKDLTFSEKTAECGLSFQGFSTQSAFCDYDLDGDLDMYLLNHAVHTQRSFRKASVRFESDSLSGDRLYRNELVPSGQLKFTNVTIQAGILNSPIGYGLGIGFSDVNLDGYPDIYVSNDFIENDYLYINQKNGTFRQEIEQSIEHASRFSMGNDLADINNDLWPEIITLDMLPRDERVIKTSAGEDSYEVYKFKLSYGYQKQVSRNSLQWNRGTAVGGINLFSDIAPLAGVEATDWSWAPLLADFDGDGLKDLFITNGIVRRPNDLDYINYISNDSAQKAMKKEVLTAVNKMPEGKVSNFIFKNKGDYTFEDMTNLWGLQALSFSNGAAYGDLDNDGDLDLVVNNINDGPFIYRNQSSDGRFLSVKLIADSLSANVFGVGAKVILSKGISNQYQELFPTRGWCSSSDYKLSFGVGGTITYDSITVVWPDGRFQKSTITGAFATMRYSDAKAGFDYALIKRGQPILQELKPALPFVHREDDFNSFNREGLMPHMLTTEGPPLAVGDVNGDNILDAYLGGGKGQPGALFIQSAKNKFNASLQKSFLSDSLAEDTDAAFFDADGDRDLDLIVVGGGQELASRIDGLIPPRLYLNDGKGKFIRADRGMPEIYPTASCVKPHDADGDGDLDLFIGNQVMPLLYGMGPRSYLLINDGKGRFSPNPAWLIPGKGRYETPTSANVGMVSDAAWMDVNGDKLPDIVAVGYWMPITILVQNGAGQFQNLTEQFGLSRTRGWWNSLLTGDFDKDGDLDLIAGNLGLNSRLRATPERPVTMRLGDFDNNGGSDHILMYYNGDTKYPFPSRDALIKQLPYLKKKFLLYSDYQPATLDSILTPEQIQMSEELTADIFHSVYVENKKGKFEISQLPVEAQISPIYALQADDVNGDGNLDVLLAGNFTATQPDLGPYDAGIGLLLLGDGKGKFITSRPAESGFIVKGEARDIEIIRTSQNEKIYLVSRNNEAVVAFKQTVKK